MLIRLKYYAILCQFCFTFSYAILCYWNRNCAKTLKTAINQVKLNLNMTFCVVWMLGERCFNDFYFLSRHLDVALMLF